MLSPYRGKFSKISKVLIADDHLMVCAGLQRLIDAEPDLVVKKMVHTGNAVLDVLATDRFDIVLLDLCMPEGGGINLVRRIRSRIVDLPILVVTIYDGAEIAQAVIEAGANGFIGKASDPEQLLHAIREVARGKPFMELRLLKEIAFASAPDPLKTLSPREKEVLELLAGGVSNREIARLLKLSEKTVSTHRVRLSVKLGAHSLADLMHHAKRLTVPEGEKLTDSVE